MGQLSDGTYGIFSGKKITLGPISEAIKFPFNTGPLFPRIRGLRTIFKATLLAVDMI